MSFTCMKCGGLALEGLERLQNWGYGGQWCHCMQPWRPDKEVHTSHCPHCGKSPYEQPKQTGELST